MGKLTIRRGTFATLPTLDSGEPDLTTDTGQVFIGTPTGNIEFQMASRTVDYSVYMATTALGGDTNANGKTGRLLESGTTDGTTANKLIDSGAAFTSALVGQTVYNATDDTWAKVTGFDSATQLSLSADIFASGEDYEIASAVNNLPDAFGLVDSGFRANPTVLASPGDFTDDVEFIGKTAGGAKSLIIQGSTTGTTTISGEVTIRQKIFFANLTFTGRIFEYFGADVDCTTCVTSGDDGFIITKSLSIANTFRSTSVIVFESDPGLYENIASTVTIGYSIYVATAALGGSDANNDGLLITQGSATSTSANKLVDSTANFTTAKHDGKTVYNTTDKTWAEITAVDSTTQVTLDTDIMASGENYKLVGARSTVQGGIDKVPGSVNAETTVKISNGTFTENALIQGKTPAGAFDIILEGTLTLIESLTAGTGSVIGNGTTRGTVVRNSGTWTLNQRQHKLLRFTSGNNDGITRLIGSNNASTTATIVSTWYDDGSGGAAPLNGDTFVIEDWGTIIEGSTTGNGITLAAGQKSIVFKDLRPINGGALFPVYSATWLNPFAQATAYRCNFDNPDSGVYGVGADILASLVLFECFVGAQANGTTGIYSGRNAVITSKRSKVYKSGRTGQSIRADGGKIEFFWGSELDHVSQTGVGGYANSHGLLVFFSGVSDNEGSTYIMNCATGITATEAGQAKLTTSPFLVYTGNTADENAIAASFGYID